MNRLLSMLILFMTVLLACSATNAEKMSQIEMVTLSPNAYGPTHPALVSDLLGIASPIRYRLHVDRGSQYVMVLGFAERYWKESGKRVMDVLAEGADPITIDVVESVGYRTPYVIAVKCEDANADGWLTLEVRQHPGAPDLNPSINAIWLFDAGYWVDNNLTPSDVLSGKYDLAAIYLVDCGRPGSEYVEQDCLANLPAAKRTLQAIRGLADKNESVKAKCGSMLDNLLSQADRIDTDNVKEGKSFIQQVDALKGAIKPDIVSMYSPAFDLPIESRMFSPWGSLIRIRHEQAIRIDMEISPCASCDEFKYYIPWIRRGLRNWIEIIPESPESEESYNLGLGINLALKKANYDPMKMSYAYDKGKIELQLFCMPAIGVHADGMQFSLRLNTDGLANEGNLWYLAQGVIASDETVDHPIFYGIVADNAKSISSGDYVSIRCSNAAIIWGNSIDDLRNTARKVSKWARARKESDKWGREVIASLRIQGKSPYPAMMDINRRALSSMQYVSGPMLAALDGGYTNIWVRDTTNAAVHAALAGDPAYLKRWTPFLMRNPSHEILDGKDYRVFWAFPTLNVEKQQDGQFYAIRAAYTYWKLTGDSSQIKDWYPVLKEAMDYQRKVYFDDKLGLYCEININEAALKEAGEWALGEQFPDLMVDGIWPLRSFDLYINNLMYGSHLMMAEMAKELGISIDYVRNLRYARELSNSINENLWDEKSGYYKCGILLLEDGRLKDFDWNYWDSFFDYVWAATLYPMVPDPEKSLGSICSMMDNRKGKYPGNMYFAPAFAHSSYLFTTAAKDGLAEEYLDVITDISREFGWNNEMNALYFMPDTLIENLAAQYLHRPEIFTVGPWMNATVARCAYIDCNGVTLVPNGMISSVKGVRFREAVLNVETGEVKDPAGIIFDGIPINGTLRIPVSMLTPGTHDVQLLAGEAHSGILLAHTDFELRGVEQDDDAVVWTLYGYGCGTIRLKGAFSGIHVRDANNKPLDFKRWADDGTERIQVDAEGLFTVKLTKH